jgi:isoquinoline 1-oxidoreductase beta subunit
MKINRRRFLLSSALVGGGVLIGYTATRPSRHRRANTEIAGSGESFVTSLIKIEADNTVTIYVPHSEMGQGVHTSLSMMAADELDADWERVNIEQAPAIDLFANGDLVTGFAGELGAPSFLAPLISVSAVKIAELANLRLPVAAPRCDSPVNILCATPAPPRETFLCNAPQPVGQFLLPNARLH